MSLRLVGSWLLTTEVKEEWVSLSQKSAGIYLAWPLSLHCWGWSCPEGRITVWQPLLLPYLAPSLCLFKCKSALDHHWPWVCSHFTGNTGPKRLREMSKVTQLRSRTRTWTQALPPQGQSLSPHGSYEAYIIWWNTFSNLISESIASLKYARFSPQASHSMLTL